jgi:trk system potassium uptake protein TrkH
VQGVGALILWVHWRASDIVPVGDAAFYALFHAVAAFCNAGFDLFGGLPQYPEGLPADPISLLTLGWLVILGGLGIPVFMELLHRREVGRAGSRRRRLSLQTRLALWSALILILVGWAGLLISEYRFGGVLPGYCWANGCCTPGFSRRLRVRPGSPTSTISPACTRPAVCC